MTSNIVVEEVIEQHMDPMAMMQEMKREMEAMRNKHEK